MQKYGLSYPHTAHCLANGKIMISYMGLYENNCKGFDFLILNGKTFNIEGLWVNENSIRPNFGYDFWYQPYFNIMVTSEWGSPSAFTRGFIPADVGSEKYGTSIHFWNWSTHSLIKTIKYSASDVCMPLETRFCHNPKSSHFFIGCALTSNVIHGYLDRNTREWVVNEKYICMDTIPMNNWALPSMPALITDFLISMDDKYLYFANWLHGDIRQYDISNPMNPILSGQVFVGGSIRKDSGFEMANDSMIDVPNVPLINGTKIEGGPQMIVCSMLVFFYFCKIFKNVFRIFCIAIIIGWEAYVCN